MKMLRLVHAGLFLSTLAMCGVATVFAVDTSPTAATSGKASPTSAPQIPGFNPTSPPAAERSATESPLLFRRVFVPGAQIKEWPRGDLRYLPLDVGEFERLVVRAQRSAERESPPDDAQVVRADYAAVLAGDELIDGRATLEIKSHSKQPAVVSLDPCRLAIDSSQWIPEASATDGSGRQVGKRPPGVGTGGAAAAAPGGTPSASPVKGNQSFPLGVGADGKFAMRAAQSGRLEFSWTLRGQRETGGALAVALQLPPCPSNQLTLTLPFDLVPTVDQGIVSLLPDADVAVSVAATTKGDRSSTVVRRWRIDLGGQNLAVLRIARQDLIHERRPLTLARESLTYDVSTRGMQLSAELKLDVLGEPIRQVPLYLDWPLTLVTARDGDRQLAWSEEATEGSDDGLPQMTWDKVRSTLDDLGVTYPMRTRHRRIVLQLPEPLHGAGRVLRLGAVAPLPASGRLPTMSPAAPEMLWQEGTAMLLISSPLELSELRTEGCRQTKCELLSPPAKGEAVTLQYFRPDADVDVALRREPDHFQCQCGTTIDVRGTSITGHLIADVTSLAGEVFALSADVSSSWIIDSVESTPAGSVATWSVDSVAGATARLNVSLTKAIRPDRPLRLAVTGRWRRTPFGETLKSEDLRMLSFRDLKLGRRLVALRTAPPYRLQLAGGENLSRLDPERLEPVDAALLGLGAGGTIFVADGGAGAFSVTVEKETPKYSGEIHLELKVADDSLAETYKLACTPDSSEIDHLLVHFSQANAEPPQWKMITDDETLAEDAEPIAARKLSAAAQTAKGLSAGEVWELTWRQPHGEPFVIRATRTIPLGAATPIALASLVEAASQRGTVEIRSTGEHVPEIINRRLKPAAVPTGPPDRWPEVLAAYQYEPQQESILAATDPLPGLTIGGGKSSPRAWVWSVSLDSHFSARGHGEHVGTWRIENNGRPRATFRMPPGTVFHGAWIDGTLVPATTLDVRSGQLRLELPAGRRFPSVVLKWTCEGPTLSILSTQTVEVPEIVGYPVLCRHMNVWLPPNYRLAEGDSVGDPANGAISWNQRLFGPFGRPTGQSSFDPLETDDWKNLVGSLSMRDGAWLQAQRTIERFDASTASSGPSAAKAPINWGELLVQVQSDVVGEANQKPAPLLVDRQALADVGIVPRTLVHPATLAVVDRGAFLLDEADLTLLVSPDAILLTTRSAAMRWGTTGSTGVRSVCERAAGGPLCEQLRSAATGGSARFVGITNWNLTEMRPPWSVATHDSQPVDHAGWTVYHLELPGEGPVRIWLVRRDAVTGAGSASFLVAALLASWKGRQNWRAKGMVAALATLLALAIPACFAPLGAGVWLGILCGWTIRFFGIGDRLDRGSSPVRVAQPDRASSFQIGMVLFFVSISVPHLAKSAEERPAARSSGQGTLFDVLIPTDDTQRPTGKECLVPQPLYDELYRRVGRRSVPAQDWLITSAIYHGRFAHEAGHGVTIDGDWAARYDLQTFKRQAHVQIPFGGEGTNLVPDGVRLDGNAIQFEWKNSGRSLACEVFEPGQHQLELVFRPTPQAISPAMAVDLAIPSLPSSRLQIEFPEDIKVDVPSAAGHLERDEKGGRLSGSLGPADRLIVRWGEMAALESKPVAADVDELLWLKIRPGSVVLETRFNIRVAEGKLRQVELLADPRLRRLPLEDGSPIAQIRTETDDAHKIYLGFARPIADQVAFTVSFLLTDTSGIGSLQVPKLDVLGARTLNRRLAVSIESPLEMDDKRTGPLESIRPSAFLAAWGAADAKPQMAFQLPEGDVNPNLAVHSREPQLNSNNVLAVSLDRDRLSTSWLTDLSVQGGSIYQVHLSAPRQFMVESAVLREADRVDRPIRWSRGLLGGLTLFLPGPPAERYKLLVRGSMPSSLDKVVQLPDLRIEGCKLESQTVFALRKSNVLATVSNRSGLAEQTAKDLQQSVDRAIGEGLFVRAALATERLVTCLSGQPTASPVTLRILPNAPRVEGVEMTTMRREGDAWRAAVDLDLTISGGVLDALRFDLPNQWKGNPDVTPAIPSEIIDVPGESHKQLVLRPADPLVGAQHIRIDVAVTSAAGQRVRVPDIRPLGLRPLRRFVRLPTNSDEQQLAWETPGLSVEPLPTSFAAHSPSTEILRTYQVIGETFAATLKSVEKGTERPRVRLADIRVASLDGRSGYGAAAFDLEPGGATSCLLDMPVEYRLLDVRINDGPAALKQPASNQWNISGGTAKLPQRIEIIFLIDRAAGGEGAAAEIWRAPSLVGFSVDQALWSVNGLRSDAALAPQQRARSISSTEGEFARMETASDMLESAAGLLTSETEQQIAQVYVPWARRMLIARAAIDRERTRAGGIGVDQATNSAIRSVDEAQAKLARKLGMRRMLADLSSVRTVAGGPNELWRLAGHGEDSVTMFSVTGLNGGLTLAAANDDVGGWASRLLMAVFAAAVVAGLFWIAGRSEFQEAARRWPQLLGILAGFGWCLWLAPSVFGWGIVAASLACALWPHRKRRAASPPMAPRPPRRLSSVVTSLTPTHHFDPKPD